MQLLLLLLLFKLNIHCQVIKAMAFNPNPVRLEKEVCTRRHHIPNLLLGANKNNMVYYKNTVFLFPIQLFICISSPNYTAKTGRNSESLGYWPIINHILLAFFYILPRVHGHVRFIFFYLKLVKRFKRKGFKNV